MKVVNNSNSNDIPMVSVCLITYNHANYIGQSINSVLSQKTNFNFEVLIGEDSSSDGTREIIKEYQKKFPGKIRLCLHDRKDVISVNGNSTGRWNAFDTISQARGRYVAYLDGDDYWTNDGKLQEQVDIMESRPDISICGHWVTPVNKNGASIKQDTVYGGSCPVEFGIRDALGSTPIHPNTWLYRRFDLVNHPAYSLILRLPAGDDPLSLLILANGNGYCIRKSMSAYRLHESGTWSTKSELRKLFEELQFRISVPKLIGCGYWSAIVMGVTNNVIRLIIKLISNINNKAHQPDLLEFLNLLKTQTILSRQRIFTWAILALIISPLHISLTLLRKLKKYFL